MFNQIIELIKNSVVATTALLVSIFGIGNAPVANLPPQNSIVVPTEISQESSKDSGFFGSQLASILQALPGEEDVVVETIIPAELAEPTEETTVVETEYFDRVDIKPAVFERPLVETVVAPSVSGTQTATETIRPINPIKSNKTKTTVDVSAILNINFDNFDLDLQITEISEDDKNFFVAYQFYTMAIKDRVWQKIVKTKQMSISKTVLKDADLENYLAEELGEVVDNEIIYLKEVQKIQRDKLLKEQPLVAENSRQVASEYSALIGKSLEFDAPAPAVVIKEIEPALSAPAPVTVIEEIKTTSQGVVDNEAPTIIIQGNNPALVQIGSSYLDLGARVTDNISSGLGVKIEGDVVDTSVKGSYFVDYIAVDEAGNVAKATREVIVYDYEKPAVEQVQPEEQTEEQMEEQQEPATQIEETEIIEDVVTTSDTTTAEIVTTSDILTEGIIEDATTPTEIQIEEVAPTTKTVKEKTDTVVKKTIDAVDIVAEVVADAVDVAVEAVAETVDTAVEKTKEKTKETIEQVSETVEQVTEEIGAMIRAVHIMEMLGNIRSSLQASVVNVSSMLQSSLVGASSGSQTIVAEIGGFISNTTVGAGEVLQSANNFLEQKFKTLLENFENTGTILRTGVININSFLQSSMVGVADVSQTVLSSMGGFVSNIITGATSALQKTSNFLEQKFKTLLEKFGYSNEKALNYTYQAIGQSADGSYKIAKYVWDKSNFGKALDNISGRLGANLSDYNSNSDSIQTQTTQYEQGNFGSFILNEIKNLPQKLINGAGQTSLAMGATVKDFSKTIKSDLRNIGEQIEGADFEIEGGILRRIGIKTQNTFSEIMNFFDNHRPH